MAARGFYPIVAVAPSASLNERRSAPGAKVPPAGGRGAPSNRSRRAPASGQRRRALFQRAPAKVPTPGPGNTLACTNCGRSAGLGLARRTGVDDGTPLRRQAPRHGSASGNFSRTSSTRSPAKWPAVSALRETTEGWPSPRICTSSRTATTLSARGRRHRIICQCGQHLCYECWDTHPCRACTPNTLDKAYDS